jgi:hypothetical protein
LEGEPGQIEAGDNAGLASDKECRGAMAGRHDGVGCQIAGPAEIFEQGLANQRLDHDGRERRRRHGIPFGLDNRKAKHGFPDGQVI